MIKLFKKRMLNNLGFVNLLGKSFGRVLLLILTAYLSTKLTTSNFALFAIFWTSLKMFSFYSANNLYIIYFNKVRDSLIKEKKWPSEVSSNILVTLMIFLVLIVFLAYIIFDQFWHVIILVLCVFFNVIIRNLSEFSKADNNIFLSIFVEDILLLALFFILSLIGLHIYNDIGTLLLALLLSYIISLIVCVFLFKRKFNIKIRLFIINLSDFSYKDFKLGVNYTFLRANEVLCNFATRYLGLIYFGATFVAYAHIMYQFYNVFNLLTMSVISGYQSKITIVDNESFNRQFITSTYIKLGKTIFPFVLAGFSVLVLFNQELLELVFPKYSDYGDLLIKVAFAGMIFSIVQPLVFIFVYNNKFSNIKSLNFVQYTFMGIIFGLPLLWKGLNEQYWLLLIMIILVIAQGVFALCNFNKTK